MLKTLALPAKLIVLAVIYVVSGLLGLQFADLQSNITLIWPPAGIALAFLFILGLESWPGIFFGAFIVAYVTSGNPALALVIGMSSTLEVLVNFLLLRRLKFQPDFKRIWDILLLGLVTLATGTIVNATISVSAIFLLGGAADKTNYIYLWLESWLGHETSVLVFTPLLLIWYFQPHTRYAPAKLIRAIIVGGTPVGVAALVFFSLSNFLAGSLDHLILPFLLWVALSLQLRETTLATFLVSLIAAWGAVIRKGPFIYSTPYETMMLTWLFVTTINITTIVVGVVSHGRRMATGALQDERDFSVHVMNALGQGVTVTDRDSRFVYVNPAFARMIGYLSPEQVVGMSPRDVTVFPSQTIMNQALHDRYEGKTTTYESRLQRPDGNFIDVLVTGSPRWQGGQVIGTIAVVTDVTEQRKMEKSLRENEQRLRAIFDNAPVGILMGDDTGVLVDINDAYLEILGAPPSGREQVVGHANLSSIEVFRNAGIHDYFVRLMENGEPFSVDAAITSVFGRERNLHYQGAPLFDSDGRVNGMILVAEDISWRKESETQLRAANTQLALAHGTLHRLIQQLPIGIQVFNPDGLCTDLNSAHLEIFGVSREQIVGCYDIFADPLSEQVGTADGLRRALAGEVIKLGDIHFNFDQDKANLPFVGASGSRTVNVTFFPVFDDAGVITSIVALNQDVTDRRLSEEALRRRNTELEALRSVTLAVGSSLRLDEVLDELLTQLATLVPYVSASIALVKNNRLRFVAQRGIPEDFDLRRIEDGLNNLDSTRFVTHPVIFKDVQQEPGWIPIPGFQEYIRSWMGVSLIHRGEIVGVLNLDYDVPDFYTLMHANLAEAVAQQAALAIENARLFGNLEQLVQERTQELETANQKLTESIGKLQELDKLRAKFVADVSHELRTPITVLNTRVYLLERGGPARQADYLPGLKEQVERLSAFVESILDLSRLETLRENTLLSAVDLNVAVDQVMTLVQPRADIAGLELSFVPDQFMPRVKADNEQLLQVITNLVANAIHYTQKGWVRVTTGFASERGKVWLKVHDSGRGIAEEDLPHIFERFYRGQAGSSSIPGTGLGLSIVKEILDIHDGDIAVESVVGQGTLFTVWLPVAKS